jgi:hypothetical protein
VENDEIPVVLSGYRMTVVEPPAPKTREDGNGGQSVVVDREGVTQFVVSLFAKRRPVPGQRARKGAEVRVTLESDPGEGFAEDTQVELINPRVKAYELQGPDGRVRSGLSFKATGLKRAAGPPPQPRPDNK